MPIPDAPISGVTVNPLSNKRTGMEVMPGGVLPAQPVSPLQGVAGGIETQRMDGA